MAQFLTTEYFEEAKAVLASHDGFQTAAEGVTLGVQFAVTNGPDGDVSYALQLVKGTLDIVEGTVESPNLTIMNDYATAAAISTGEVNTQTAFISGRLRVDGDMAALIRNQELIQQFSAAMSGMDVTY